MNFLVDSIRRTSTLLLAALVAGSASSQADLEALNRLPIEDLKSAYLACEFASTQGQLGSAAIMHCSVAYEELKWRAFDGDFDKLLAWSKSRARGLKASTGSQTSTPAPAAPAHPGPPPTP